MTGVRIIGIGNAYRSDDGAGLEVAKRLRAVFSEHADIREHSGEGAALLELLKDQRVVILADAMHSGNPAGAVTRYDAAVQPLPADFFACSSHAFGPAQALELARALGELPAQTLVLGIEGANFTAGTALSPDVERGVVKAVAMISGELALLRDQ